MLSTELVKEISVRQMTDPLNIVREYLQLLFLKNFYLQKGAEKLLFKGGTTLRLVFANPRFSTDLDFDGDGASIFELEKYFQEVLLEINREETIDLIEAKKTTGGYLGKMKAEIAGLSFIMKLEVSFRYRKRKEGEVAIVNSQFLPPFTIYTVKRDDLINGKIAALLARAKARDYFDLYFILRKFLNLKISPDKRDKIMQKVKRLDNKKIARELRPLLPKSHHLILKDFKGTLLRELEIR